MEADTTKAQEDQIKELMKDESKPDQIRSKDKCQSEEQIQPKANLDLVTQELYKPSVILVQRKSINEMQQEIEALECQAKVACQALIAYKHQPEVKTRTFVWTQHAFDNKASNTSNHCHDTPIKT